MGAAGPLGGHCASNLLDSAVEPADTHEVDSIGERRDLETLRRPELERPWEHDGLEQLDPSRLLLQLFRYPSLAPMTSWTIFANGPRSRVQRLQAPPGQRSVPRHVIASDAAVQATTIARELGRLAEIELPSTISGVIFDGCSYGIRYPRRDELADFWWRGGSRSEALTDLVNSVAAVLDDHLPAYSTFTDRLGDGT